MRGLCVLATQPRQLPPLKRSYDYAPVRPKLLERHGVRVGLDGQLWRWRPGEGQVMLAASNQAADWLEEHLPRSKQRDALIGVYRARCGQERDVPPRDLLHDRQHVMQFPPEVLRSLERTTETYLVNYLGFTKIPQDVGQLFLGVSAVQPDATCIELVAEAHWVPTNGELASGVVKCFLQTDQTARLGNAYFRRLRKQGASREEVTYRKHLAFTARQASHKVHTLATRLLLQGDLVHRPGSLASRMQHAVELLEKHRNQLGLDDPDTTRPNTIPESLEL